MSEYVKEELLDENNRIYNPMTDEADGLSEHLVEFAKQVQKKIRGCYFIHDTHRVSTLTVALDGYPETLGKIFLGTSSHSSKAGKREYRVSSPNIRNERGDMNTKASVNIKTAVRNAATYLRARRYRDIVREVQMSISRVRREVVGTPSREYREARVVAFSTSRETPASEELLAIYKEGGHIRSSKLAEQLEAIVQARKDMEAEALDSPDDMVAVIPLWDRNLEAKKCALVAMKKSMDVDVVEYKVNHDVDDKVLPTEELPQYIVDTMPMLDMLGGKGYLEGIGGMLRNGYAFIEVRDD